MDITGPFLDHAKKRRQAPACWYLRYATPKLNPDGTSTLDAQGKIVLQRHRPYYESKAKTEEDKPSIREQHEKTGSGRFLFDRNAAEDYETALIMRRRGSAYTLHNSYRGLGVTPDQGQDYFEIMPAPVAVPIRPVRMPKGIIRTQRPTAVAAH